MAVTPFLRRDAFALALILLIAALMRFGQPDVVEYFHDDGMLATLAQEMAAGEAFHLTGILSSTGIPNPPTSVYALLPFFWLSRDPVFAIHGIMALNVIGVGLLWAIAQRYFGRRAALLAGLAYAVNPWAVLYSRKLWAQDYHTPFLLLGLLIGLYGFMEGDARPTLRQPRFWAQIACLPILLFAMQIHFAAWALFPLYLMLLWMGRRRIAGRAFVMSVLAGGLVLAPYGVGLAQTLQADPTRISDALGRTAIPENRPLNSYIHIDMYHAITGSQLSVATPKFYSFFRTSYPNPPADMWSLYIIPFIFVYGVYRFYRVEHPLRWWLMWWTFAPTIILSLGFTRSYPHYLIASIPAYCLCLGGVGLVQHNDGEKQKAKRFLVEKVLSVALLISFTVSMIFQPLYWRQTLDILDREHIPYPGFTTPLNRLLPIRDALQGETDVVVLSDGMAWNLNHEVSVWDTLLYDVPCVRTLRGDGYTVQPAQPFAVLVAPNAPASAIRDLYSGGTPQIFPERPGGGHYELYRLTAAPDWETTPPLTPIAPVSFANGVTLTGYSVGDVTTLQWRLPQGRRGDNVQYTVQFFDAAGERVGQADKVFWQADHWCAGDTLFTWVDTPQRAGAVTLRVGLYALVERDQYRPIVVLDGNGPPMGDTAALPLP